MMQTLILLELQIAWDYNRGKPAVWYRFDTGSGSTTYDASGNSNNGSITIGAGGTQTTTTQAWSNGASGKINGSLNLDGNDDFVTTSAFSPLAASGQTTTNLSWGGWFYPTTSAVSKTLIEKASEFQLTTDSNSKPVCGVYYSAAFHDATAGSTALSLNSWNHVVCTYDGTSIKTYLNGQQIGSSSETSSITAASSILYMGESSGGTARYQGQIDDVKMYNYSLTGTQIKTLHNKGSVSF